MNWRAGYIIVGPPRSFAAFGSQDEALILELPLVFFNRGATPMLVQNLRLRIEDEPSDKRPLTFIATVAKLGTDEGRAFSTQFPLRSQEAVLRICEFQRKPGRLLFEARSYPLVLDAVLNASTTWKPIARFDLNVRQHDLDTVNSKFTAHDNWE
jgi:hypothetical protein